MCPSKVQAICKILQNDVWMYTTMLLKKATQQVYDAGLTCQPSVLDPLMHLMHDRCDN